MTDNSGTGTGSLNPFRYRGYFYDEETGWYYLKSRYYDPEVGRFINADTKVCVCTGSVSYSKVFSKYYARKSIDLGGIRIFCYQKRYVFGGKTIAKKGDDTNEKEKRVVKKQILFGTFILVCIIIGGSCLQIDKVKTMYLKNADIYFFYEDFELFHHLDDKELKILKSILNGKKLYRDNPSCGFSENISIKFNDEQTFCIARDSCPIIYWKEKDKYIKLSKKEKQKLYGLLETYGLFFPCV